MKRLLIMRHAKSSWKDSDLTDHERPLKKRGKNDAHQMGKLLKSKKIVPDMIICSTAQRAKETAELLADAMKYKDKIILSDALYMAEPFSPCRLYAANLPCATPSSGAAILSLSLVAWRVQYFDRAPDAPVIFLAQVYASAIRWTTEAGTSIWGARFCFSFTVIWVYNSGRWN